MAPPGNPRQSLKPPTGPPSSYQNQTFASTKCRCCPYGFHIDLDFVKFAENVTSGTDYIQKWNTDPRKSKKKPILESTIDQLYAPRQVYRGAHSFDTADEWLNPDSTMESVMSYSTIGGYQTEDEQSLHELTGFSNGGYLGKNKSDSQVARLISELNGIENSRKPPIPPPISSSTPYPGVSSGYTGWNSGNSTEIQEIFSRKANSMIPQNQTREFSKYVISAPTTPIPTKSYHSSVAQAAVRKLSQPSTIVDAEPSPPRRYIDSARPRVLSPEPGNGDGNLPITMLRTSNLHSRSYFNSNGSSPGTASTKVPYRNRKTSSLTHGLDFDSFVSVRRQRTSEDSQRARAFSPNTREFKLDGYTSDADYQSMRYEMSPPAGPPTNEQFIPSEVPIRNYVNYRTFESNEPAQVSIIYENRASQTRLIKTKDESTNPEVAKFSNQESQTQNEAIVASTDTEDLVSEEQLELQSVKQLLAELEAKKPKMEECSVEFQFAMGHEPEYHPDEEPIVLKKKTKLVDIGTDAPRIALFSMFTNTEPVRTAEKGCMPMPPPVKPKTAEKGILTESENKKMDSKDTQTDQVESMKEMKEVGVEADTKIMTESKEVQTDNYWVELEVQKRLEAEKVERKSVDKITETEEDSGEFIMTVCSKCEQTSVSDGHEHYQKINVVEEIEAEPSSQSDSLGDQESGFSNCSTDLEEFERLEKALQEEEMEQDDPNVPPEPLVRYPMPPDPDYSDHDSVSLDTVSINTMIMVEPMKDKKEEPIVKTIDPSKIEALRKLLMEPRQHFSRDSGSYRSVKMPKSRTTEDLDYIASKHPEEKGAAEPSMPSEGSQTALTEVVMLKKMISMPPSPIPEPVPAKIPRPKVSRFSLPVEQAATPDEEEEAADKLTPLRSELKSLADWGYAGGPHRITEYRRYAAQQNQTQQNHDDEIEGEIQNSEASSDSDGTYDLSENEENDVELEVTEPLKDALTTLDSYLRDADSIATQAVEWANKYVQHEWFKMATKKKSNSKWVESFLDYLDKSFSVPLMQLIINFTDNNGNTALHYAVSHENYDLVSVLLDSKVCEIDKMNMAGYSSLMLASLCEIQNETQSTIIQRLFEIGDVNAKALKHGQTALQLASSHGRVGTCQLLLDCGADVNIQDVDGSTALMCSSEHGHKDVVKMLLKCPNIDASLTDCDNQTALSIAIQGNHKAIAVLIYAHLNFTRYQSSSDHSTV